MSTKRQSLYGRSLIESQAIASEDRQLGWAVRFLKMDRGFRRCIDYTAGRCLVCHFTAVATDEFFCRRDSVDGSGSLIRKNQFTGVRRFQRHHRNSHGTSAPPKNIAPSKACEPEFVRVTTALRLRSDADDAESFAQRLRPSSNSWHGKGRPDSPTGATFWCCSSPRGLRPH